MKKDKLMKNLLNLAVVILLCVSATMASAQEFKFGHINSSELIAAMPESDSAQAAIESLAREYELQMEEMNVELNKKYDDYINKRDSYTELIRQTKEADITEMQQRIGAFEQNAQMDLQTQQQEMLRPILERANNAVKEVAEENGFIYVFDISRGNPVYFSEKSVDVLELVKTKLGI
jgi:outer membrane protein